MSYVMELHHAHEARLRRLWGWPSPHGERSAAPVVAPSPAEAPAAEKSGPVAPVAVTVPPPPLRWQAIVQEVAATYGVSVLDLMSHRKSRRIVYARQEACWRLYHETMMSSSQIGRCLGGRDHTTVLWGIRRHAERMQEAAHG